MPSARSPAGSHAVSLWARRAGGLSHHTGPARRRMRCNVTALACSRQGARGPGREKPDSTPKSDPVSVDTVWTTMTAAKEAGHARQATEVHDSWQ